MSRYLILTALCTTLLLSGCASMDGVFGRPAPSRPVYGKYSTSTPSVAPSRQYDPKTKPYTVMGKRYFPIQNAAGYDEVGVASWYGTDFHGKPTASGDIYNMNGMTAAHKTLPLGTIVAVTNLENGRRVDLLVNDRGPFVGERLIDLSYAAARSLGSDQTGLARVRIQAVGSATARNAMPTQQAQSRSQSPRRSSTASTSTMTATSSAASGYDVQVGAFRDSANANKVLQHLQSKGFGGAHIARVNSSGGALHLVRVRANSKDQAQRALQQVRVYYPSSFITS